MYNQVIYRMWLLSCVVTISQMQVELSILIPSNEFVNNLLGEFSFTGILVAESKKIILKPIFC